MSGASFVTVASQALIQANSLLSVWVPGGKAEGPEWVGCNPARADNKPGSFKVNLHTGRWSDFATGNAGGDLISLYAYLHGVSQSDALKVVADMIGEPIETRPRSTKSSTSPNRTPAGDDLSPIGPVVSPNPSARPDQGPDAAGEAPATTPSAPAPRSDWIPLPFSIPETPPPTAHITRGRPDHRWDYRDDQGRLIGCVYRFTRSGGEKIVIPCVWAKNSTSGKTEWRWLSFAAPRPLYIPGGLGNKDLKILIVEGEKCADAANKLFGERIIPVTWPGGCKAVGKINWSPLAGRHIIIWPDCDNQLDKSGQSLPQDKQPGYRAALQIAERLKDIGCQVSIVDIPAPGAVDAGWDIADAIETMTVKQIGDMIRSAIPFDLDGRSGDQGDRGNPPDGDGHIIFRDKNGTPLKNRENIITILERDPDWSAILKYDEFAARTIKAAPTPTGEPAGEWSTHDLAPLGRWLADNHHLPGAPDEMLNSAALAVAWQNRYHPIVDWLETLVWDGKLRLDSWLFDYMTAVAVAGVTDGGDEYVSQVGRFFILGMVARAYRPGCQMQYMPILEGRQGVGKSTALRIIGGKWHRDTPFDVGKKDAYDAINGVWLYEIAELDSFNRAETTAIKSFISQQDERYRPAYERVATDHPRQTMLVGTTNQVEYLKDDTGNRRFWPVRIDHLIDLDGLAAAREQLFAEAVHRFKSGEPWHPTREDEERYFRPEQDARVVEDAWEEIIADWLPKQTTRITMAGILFECLKIPAERVDGSRAMTTRIGKIVHHLGWVKKRLGAGDRASYYVRAQNG